VSAQPTNPAWSSEALFSKALLYVEQMERHTAEEWQFALWSSLSLELIARAALAFVSPTLLADGKNWRNVYHALGNAVTKKGFVPISVPTNEVLSRLQELLPDFTQELVDSCAHHCRRRNAELHSGEDAFAGLGTSEWLPKYYASCDVLLRFMGKGLADLFRDPTRAQQMIASLRDIAAEAVNKEIFEHRQIWDSKTPGEREQSKAEAAIWASRQAGHRTGCPACGNTGLIRGYGQGEVTTQIDGDLVVQKQTMLPSSFECVACGIKIIGLSKLLACGLGSAYTATSTASAAEFFGLHTSEELEEARASAAEPEWEEDFNE
jgi:hypothetical protein